MGLSSTTSGEDYGAALRLRVAHLMDTVTFDPPGMPPSSILLVRRLSDPLPRRLMSHPEAIAATADWERAARDRLADCFRRAARPARGLLNANADSVLFSDQGEMLACLACDLLNGNAAGLWWWRAILRTLPPGALEALVAAWRREARYVPAALSLLSVHREAVRVLTALSPVQAWTIFQDVTREFDLNLPETGSIFYIGSSARSEELREAGSEQGRQPPILPTGAKAARRVLPPWFPRISAGLAPESLGPERLVLLGVSLLLHCSPETVRSARFGERFSAWLQSVQHEASQSRIISEYEVVSGTLRDVVPTAAVTAVAAEVGADEASTPPLLRPISARSIASRITISHSTPSGPPAVGALEENKRMAEPFSASPSAAPDSFSSAVRSPVKPAGEGVSVSVAGECPSTEAGSLSATLHREGISPMEISHDQALERGSAARAALLAHSPEEPLPTELGGVLFLVNLLRALNLPAGFESEFGLELMNGWELVELLARSLLGPSHGPLAGDPIWNVLANLAGRHLDIPPGTDFRGQKRYRLPVSWISPLDLAKPSTLGIRLRGSHLQIWHPEGFPAVDCLWDRRPSRHAIEGEARSLIGTSQPAWVWTSWRALVRRGQNGCSPLGLALSGELRRFLAFLLSFIRWRLVVGLGLGDATSLVESLLVRRGRLFVTTTHIDLVMSLNQASAPVRIAGLDADPGWVPDLGRVVTFSFVEESFL